MKPKHVITAAFVAAFFVLGIALYQYEVPVPGVSPVQSSSTSTAPDASTSTVATSYTMEQVAKHGSNSSCWSAINGKVYDLTNWIGQHPGGPDRILSICGKDGSSDFNQQHGGDPEVESILRQFYIGTLAVS